MTDRRRMKKLRAKRIYSLKKQVRKHEEKIQKEKGKKDTTKEYWRKEIDSSFLKQIKKDEDYMEETNGNTDKKNN